MSSTLTQKGPAPPPAPPLGTPISYKQAHRVAEVARKAAEYIGVPNAIAIVEPTGELVLFLKMDGVPYSAVQLHGGNVCAVSAANRSSLRIERAIPSF